MMKDISIQIFFRLFLFLSVGTYLSFFFERKKISFITLIPWFFLLLWQITVRIMDFNSPWLHFYVHFILIFCIAVISYKGNLQLKLFTTCIFNCFWLLCDLTWRRFLNSIQFYTPTTLAAGYFFLSLLLLSLLFLFRRGIRKFFRLLFHPGQLLYLFFIPAGTIITLHYFSTHAYVKNPYYFYLFLIGLNILVFYLYYELAKGYEREKEIVLYQEQLNLCSHYTDTQIKLMDQFHKERHDLKHFFFYLNQLLEENKKDLLQKALTDKINSFGFSSNSSIFYTQNLAIDALLKHYSQLAKQYNVDFEPHLQISPDISVTAYDLILLLGNALDNAFEAIFQLKEKRPFLHLLVKEEKGLLLIQTENPYEGTLKCLESGQYSSSKKQPGHGYGLTMIRQIVEKYHGSVFISTENHIFHLELFLYLS